MSKLSFRARALDASKPMPIYLAEELPDLPEYSAINRAVPQMPSGMEKEEECEHHLQRAICTGLIIPTPEVYQVEDLEFYEKCYPSNYKMPKQHIHMQPLWHEQEAPEYDIDSEDDRWLKQQRHPELTEVKFEEMMDKLERSSGQTVVTLNEAKLLLERNDDLVIAIYDYWLNKRLKTERPLIPCVKTECRPGQPTNNPYLAFRRRTEKMQTRKNRKNDESSYEKMLKLRRDLARALTLLELVAKREKAKRDLVKLTALLAERRYANGDFAGQMLADIPQSRPTYSAVALAAQTATFRREPFIPNYASTARPTPSTTEQTRQRDKRPYKRRKHRIHATGSVRDSGVYTSSEEESSSRAETSTPPDDGPYAFRRKAGCLYEMPTTTLYGDPLDPEDTSKEALYKHEVDERYRFNLTTLKTPHERCIGFARRRMGRGGRMVLDRVKTPLDDLWPDLPFQFPQSSSYKSERAEEVKLETEQHLFPMTLSRDFQKSRRHPWRHAFRKHVKKNPSLWTDSDNVISLIDNSVVPIVRKRPLSDDSDSSYDSDASLNPAEQNFESFIEDVSKNWLHFRAKSPPRSESPSPEQEDLQPVDLDTPLSVEINSLPSETFTTSEFTLRQLYDIEPDLNLSDDLTENLGLSEAQVESMLSETDLKSLELKDKKLSDDILDELVKEVESPFLGKKRPSFGSSVVSVLPAREKLPIFVEKAPQVEVKIEPKTEVKSQVKSVVCNVTPPQVKMEPKKPPQPVQMQKEETLQELTLSHGVQLKTVQTKHSPLKKHIITSTARRSEPTMPQIVTVAVSDNLKVRLQNHVLSSTSASGETSVVGLLQNGPYTVAATVPGTIAAQNIVPGASSPRRLSSPVLLPPGKVKLLSSARVPAVVSLNARGQVLQLRGPQLVNVLRADRKRVLLTEHRPRLSVALRAPVVNVRPRASPPSRPLPPALVANLLHKTVHLPKQKLAANVQAIAFSRQGRLVQHQRPSEETTSASTASEPAIESEERNANGSVRRRTNEPMEVT